MFVCLFVYLFAGVILFTRFVLVLLLVMMMVVVEVVAIAVVVLLGWTGGLGVFVVAFCCFHSAYKKKKIYSPIRVQTRDSIRLNRS